MWTEGTAVGSKYMNIAFIGFGFFTISMTVAVFLFAYRGIQSVARVEGRAIQLSDLFTNSMLYIFASLIFVSRLFTFTFY